MSLLSLINTANKILTRYNLENPTLKNLTTTEIIALQNPNKNSCLVTKLEIVKKICKLKKINNSNFNNNLEKYITELKNREIPSEAAQTSNAGNSGLSPTALRAVAALKNKHK
jgi:hypothetical protein